jgi:uncharacterized membrane protein
MLEVWQRLLAASTVALIIAVREYRKGNLSWSGSCAAAIVGTFHLAAGVAPAVLLLTFFFTSTLLTKYGRQEKLRFARDDVSSMPCVSGRRAMQVFPLTTSPNDMFHRRESSSDFVGGLSASPCIFEQTKLFRNCG